MPAARKTTTQRGLGNRHRQQAAWLKTPEGGYTPGMPCWWCGEPMYLEQGLDADHSVPRSQGGTLADRLLHGPCNSERGDGSRDHLRPALVGRKAQAQQPDIGHTVMHWPWSRA